MYVTSRRRRRRAHDVQPRPASLDKGLAVNWEDCSRM